MKTKIDLKRVKLSQLKMSDYNPRVHDKNFLKDLEGSFSEFGYVEPIVWNKRTGNVVGGHARVELLTRDGTEEVDVSVVDLPLKKEKRLNIILNNIMGYFDNEKLNQVLKDLDGDVEGLGFDDLDLDFELDDIPSIDEVLTSVNKSISSSPYFVVLCIDLSKARKLDSLISDAKSLGAHVEVSHDRQ
jgi:hypothetical protein